jgi:hypothetical protein
MEFASKSAYHPSIAIGATSRLHVLAEVQMSFAIAPEFVTGAASDLANVGSAINAANAAAAAFTSDRGGRGCR